MKSKNIVKRYCTPQQVEELYGIPVGTLANWRCQKRGPEYFIIGSKKSRGRKILYAVESLESWIRQNPVLTIDSLSEKK